MRLQRIHDWLIENQFKVPAVISGIGLPLSFAIGAVTASFTNALVLEGFFVSGTVVLWDSLWQTRHARRQNEAAILDSVRRSLLRQLQTPYCPEFLDKIIRGGLPRLDIRTPIVIAHLNEAIELAAKNFDREHLYTLLLEVRKLIDHLNFLGQVYPQIFTSPWATAGLDVVSLELAINRTSGLTADQQTAVYRYQMILVERFSNEAQFHLLLDDFLRQSIIELAAVLAGYPLSLKDPPQLKRTMPDDVFASLKVALHPHPIGMEDDMRSLKMEALRLKEEVFANPLGPSITPAAEIPSAK